MKYTKVATGKNTAGEAEIEEYPPAWKNPAKAVMGWGRHGRAGI